MHKWGIVSKISGWARILTVGTICAFFVVCFLGLVLGAGVSRNPGQSRPEQCEALATDTDPSAVVLEPQNTWSNFGYLVAGTLILYRSRTLLGAAVGLNLAFEFLFSSLYHSKLTDTLQLIDVAWIYVLLLSLIGYAIQSLLFHDWAADTGTPTFRGTFWQVLTSPVVIALGIAIVTAIVGIVMGIHKNDIFDSTWTTLVLAGVLILLFSMGLIVAGLRGCATMTIVAPILMVLSAGIPTLLFKFSDGPKHLMLNWCCAKATLQAHSAWHILSALLVLIAYDFFAHFSGDGRILTFASGTGERLIPPTEAY